MKQYLKFLLMVALVGVMRSELITEDSGDKEDAKAKGRFIGQAFSILFGGHKGPDATTVKRKAQLGALEARARKQQVASDVKQHSYMTKVNQMSTEMQMNDLINSLGNSGGGYGGGHASSYHGSAYAPQPAYASYGYAHPPPPPPAYHSRPYVSAPQQQQPSVTIVNRVSPNMSNKANTRSNAQNRNAAQVDAPQETTNVNSASNGNRKSARRPCSTCASGYQ
ncbi:hypothetical protein SNEBB_003377 [Seison nebaliae]|nr:hypothetical protein SNEBB_003377 [Seison nebaliae]